MLRKQHSLVLPRLFVSVVAAWLNPAIAQVGVTDGGSPNIIQGIGVPPGVHGMSPSLAIVYSGSGVNGPLGLGWSLQAGSLITRCASTIAVDSRKVAVNYGIDDKLCLNGQRLIHVNPSTGTAMVGVGTNDAAGLGANAYNEFRTESDSYFRVRSYGYANGDTTGASGPAYFKVWTKAGQIIEYGASPSADANTKALVAFSTSTAGVVWATARMSDVIGNHIDYKYEQRDVAWGSGNTAGTPTAGHEWNLVEIQYSGNKIVFGYSDRAAKSPQDASEAYTTIGKNASVRLLNAVTTYVNSPNTTVLGPSASAVPVQTVKLTYENGPVTQRSRLKYLQSCAGGPTSTRCLPASTFNYAPGGNDAYVAASAFNESTLQMQSSAGNYGTLTGDFNGDGKTDLIRWSAVSASENQMLLSNGDGSFTPTPNFNITNQKLFSVDGCYVTFVTDVNGDGLPDLIRSSAAAVSPTGTACPSPTASLVYVNKGDGSFSAPITYAGPALLRDPGHNFYFLDYDGDGKVDLVTAVVGTTSTNQIGQSFLSCGDPSGICTHVYHGNGDGSFTEVSTNIGSLPVGYGPTLSGDPNLVGRIADLDGDGLQDIGGIYYGDTRTQKAYGLRSRGDGNFDTVSFNSCLSPIDFNGDGVADCMDGGTRTMLSGPTWSPDANFNLTVAGQELAGPGIGFVVADINGDGKQDILRWEDDSSKNVLYLSNGDGSFTASSSFNLAGVQLQKSDSSASMLIGDFTGHGNAEILRVQTVGSTVSNQLYVKQTMTPPDQLVSVTAGSGATTSFYYVPLANSTPVAGPSASLGPRYVSDALTANAAVSPTADLTTSQYVVATMVSDSGVGTSTINTEMAYAGLKADARGRGPLGFRDVKRQTVGANGLPLTLETQYLQAQPYIGFVASKTGFNAALNATSSANLLNKDVNVYCDQTLSGATATAISTGISCPTSSVIQRPYLLYTTHTAKDLTGIALPTVTSQATVNANADPTQVIVTTTGTVGGVNQTFTKTVNTIYQPDITSCSADGTTCSWILSRATQTTVENSVPNSLASLTTSAGTAPGATATQGTGQTQFGSLTAVSFGNVTVGAQPTATATLSNPGQLPLNVTVPAASSVTGTGFSFVSTTCAATLAPAGTCTVTVKFAPTGATAFTGSLAVNTGAGTLTGNLTGSGTAPSVTFSPVSTNWGTVGAASDSGDWPTIVNHSTVPVLITAHSVASGPAGVYSWQGDSTHCQPGTTVLQPNASCQTFFGTGGLATVGSYTAVDGVSFQAVGVTQTTFTSQQSYAFSIATITASSSSLSFGSVTANTTSAGQSFYVVNNASSSPVNIGVSMVGSQPANFPMTTTCGSSLVAGASCTVTVAFNPTAVASFSAAVQVTYSYPRMQGGQNSGYYPVSTNLSVPVSGTGAGAIATLTSAATQSVGWQGAISVTYRNDGGAAMTLTPPSLGTPLSVTSNSCSSVAPSGTCTMVVSDTACCYTGTVAFTPSGTATAPATTSISYNVSGVIARWNPTSVNFGTVSVGSSASQSVQLFNDGSTTQDWTHHNTFNNLPAGFTIAAVGSSTGAGNCVFIAQGQYCNMTITFAPTASGSYGGTNITPAADSFENSLSVSGTSLTAPAVSASPTSYSNSTTAPQAITTSISFSNAGQTPTTLTLSLNGGASLSTSTLSCPASGSCGSVTVTTPSVAGTYSGTLTASSSAGGSVPSVPMTMTVAPSIAAFTVTSSVTNGSSNTTTFKNPNSVAVTPSSSGLNSNGSIFPKLTSNTCTSSIAAGGTCTIVIYAAPPDCVADNYSANSYVTDSGGTAAGSRVSASTTNKTCN